MIASKTENYLKSLIFIKTVGNKKFKVFILYEKKNYQYNRKSIRESC